MFSLLVSLSDDAWESDQRKSIPVERFGEYSGDEAATISTQVPASLATLEGRLALLMSEEEVKEPQADVVRVGFLRDIRTENGRVSFRFSENGRLQREVIRRQRHRLQIDKRELSRTYWAIKDGDIPQDVLAAMVETPRMYEILLSFAGEDRGYVQQVAECLVANGVDVFYDGYELVTLWGKDLAEHFKTLYRRQAQYCVMFVSKYYVSRVWTRHESRAAFARALAERSEYVLPARFDDTDVPGLRPTVGFLDLRHMTPRQLADAIVMKLGRTPMK